MVAGEHDVRPTCLSDQEHSRTIQNHVLHYLGCIEIGERDSFFEVENQFYQTELQHVYKRLLRESKDEREYRRLIEAQEIDLKVRKEAEDSVKEKVKGWKDACLTEIRRIKYLRSLIAKDRESQQLAWSLEESRTKWEKSDEYKLNLPKVQAWRAKLSRPVSAATTGPTTTRRPEARESEGSIPDNPLLRVQSLTTGNRGQPNSLGERFSRVATSPVLGDEGRLYPRRIDQTIDRGPYEPEKDFNLHIMEYEDTATGQGDEANHPTRGKRYISDRKVKIDMILGRQGTGKSPKDNPLYGTKEPGKLRYIHLPANNMVWVEEALARYYGEERPDYDGVYRELQPIDKTQTYMILRPQFWRGQQHGGRNAPPHARHMRPLCETVSSNPKSVDQSPKNVVLFMPYLHWESDRQRDKFAMEIENITESWRREKKAQEEEAKKARRDLRKDLDKVVFKAWPDEDGKDTAYQKNSVSSKKTSKHEKKAAKSINQNGHTVNSNSSYYDRRSSRGSKGRWPWSRHKSPRRPTLTHQPESRMLSFPTLIKSLGYGVKKGLPVQEGRVICPNALGQFLIDAARLYEEMANYRDKKLLQKYLHNELPLHPRRTLDQAYYWTLNTTKNRDRDQVVYRGTKSGSFHEYNPYAGEWPDHKEQEITPEKGCDECRANIRRISRVTMVDQLWMWILDEQTVITCFPKRYGANKQENDVSSVHKSIRIRLQNARQNHVRSAFDLALVIFDECSNTLFDRTKTRDRQPQVMDLFSEAIGNVTNKQTAAFDRLYRWTQTAAKIYRTKGKVDPEAISDLHVPLLDIYPEGILQREVKDIIEELDIMIDLTRTQKAVLKDFIMHVEHILDPQGIYGYRKGLRKIKAEMLRSRDHDKGKDTERAEDASGQRHKQTHDHGFATGNNPTGQEGGDAKDGKDDKHQTYDWFKINADELVAKVTKRIEDLEVLKRTAESTSSSLTDLLALKQQQASVVQAWQSVKQSEEAVSQGRSIMMFTVVTIFFLPLSFMASVFGMNASEFGQGQMKLIHEFKYMLPISFIIIIPIFILAFSTWIRAFIWFVYKYTVTLTIVKTGVYSHWLRIGWTSRTLLDKAAKETEKLKNEVRAQMCELQRAERKKEDDEWMRSHGITPTPSSNGYHAPLYGNVAPEAHDMA